VFPELHVALLGFNSCYRNDRYWHGAQIHEDAITEARDHVDRFDNARNFLRIGVWHHGMESHRSRPDRLTFENLTALVTSGIKVGFHGHVHKSHTQLPRFITDDFALVSTGTLGAAADDRPDAIANQFSIVDLHRNRLRVDVYESEGPAPTARARIAGGSCISTSTSSGRRHLQAAAVVGEPRHPPRHA
jgi:hypothetical protein